MLVDKHRQKMVNKKYNERRNFKKKNQEKLKFSPVLFLTFTNMNKTVYSVGPKYHMLLNRIILLGGKDQKSSM